jgi:hypothetical protein
MKYISFATIDKKLIIYISLYLLTVIIMNALPIIDVNGDHYNYPIYLVLSDIYFLEYLNIYLGKRIRFHHQEIIVLKIIIMKTLMMITDLIIGYYIYFINVHQ